jgi:putative peptide zinc metalloprotease protein
VLHLVEPVLASQRAVQQARRDAAQVRYDAALTVDPTLAAQVAPALARETEVLAHLDERHERLVVRSKVAGQLWLPASEDLRGRLMRQGQVMAYVVAPTAPRVRIIVDQMDENLIRARTRHILVKVPFDPGRAWPATVVRAVPSASRDLPSAALGRQGGGGVVTDPRDESGRKALTSYFEYELALPDDFPHHLIGSRASVRFEHAMEPVGYRLWRSVRRLFLGYFHA